MSIVNGVIEDGTPIGGEVFTFFNVGKDANGRYNWGAIPASPNLRKESKYKPVNYTSDTNITDAQGTIWGRRTKLNEDQKREVNYGNNIYALNNPIVAIRDIMSGTFGAYNRPSSWFRLADLWKYDHNQQYWLEYSTSVSSATKGSTIRLNMDSQQFTDMFLLKAAKDVNASMDNWNFGFIMHSSFNSNQSAVSFLSLTDMSNAQKKISAILTNGNFTINTSNLGVGTYKMYPCLTTGNFAQFSYTSIREDNTSSRWLPIPFANIHTLSIVSSGGDEDVLNKYIVCEGLSADLQSAGYMTYKMLSLGVSFYNDGNSPYTISFNIEIDGAMNNVNKPTLSGQNITVPAKDSVYIEVYAVKDENEAYRFEVAESPTATVTYWLSADSGQKSNSETFDLMK